LVHSPTSAYVRRTIRRRRTGRRRLSRLLPVVSQPQNHSYNCLRTAGETVVLGNGTHVAPITEKLGLGYPPRDALAESLLALDYEKDDYETPRIAGIIGEESYVGTVRRDALLVRQVDEPTLVATYENDSPTPTDFDAADADTAAREAYDMAYDHAICAAGVRRAEDGLSTAIPYGTE